MPYRGSTSVQGFPRLFQGCIIKGYIETINHTRVMQGYRSVGINSSLDTYTKYILNRFKLIVIPVKLVTKNRSTMIDIRNVLPYTGSNQSIL